MALQFNNATIEIDGTQNIVVSDIQPTVDGLYYVRLVQIYTDPASNTNRRPVLEIRCVGGDATSGDKGAVTINIPPETF